MPKIILNEAFTNVRFKASARALSVIIEEAEVSTGGLRLAGISDPKDGIVELDVRGSRSSWILKNSNMKNTKAALKKVESKVAAALKKADDEVKKAMAAEGFIDSDSAR